MTMTISGSGTIAGISQGGLNDNIITSAEIVDGNVTQAKLGTGIAGNGPAFSANSAGQQISGGTWTKILYDTLEYDTANCYLRYNGNSKFTPNVAGYYLITGMWTGGPTTATQIGIYKNGAAARYGYFAPGNAGGAIEYSVPPITAVVYLNGSTDYVEIYGYTSSTININTGGASSYFQGTLLRAA